MGQLTWSTQQGTAGDCVRARWRVNTNSRGSPLTSTWAIWHTSHMCPQGHIHTCTCPSPMCTCTHFWASWFSLSRILCYRSTQWFVWFGFFKFSFCLRQSPDMYLHKPCHLNSEEHSPWRKESEWIFHTRTAMQIWEVSNNFIHKYINNWYFGSIWEAFLFGFKMLVCHRLLNV